MNIANVNEERLNQADKRFEKRVIIPRAEVELLLMIEEARAIIEAQERKLS